jgi:hypothetical protein
MIPLIAAMARRFNFFSVAIHPRPR